MLIFHTSGSNKSHYSMKECVIIVYYCRNSAFITQGGGVKFYLEADPTDPDKERIAIFTYMDEQPIDANKYYLQRFTNNSSIVAITGSQLGSAPLYIFRFRSV